MLESEVSTRLHPFTPISHFISSIFDFNFAPVLSAIKIASVDFLVFTAWALFLFALLSLSDNIPKDLRIDLMIFSSSARLSRFFTCLIATWYLTPNSPKPNGGQVHIILWSYVCPSICLKRTQFQSEISPRFGIDLYFAEIYKRAILISQCLGCF